MGLFDSLPAPAKRPAEEEPTEDARRELKTARTTQGSAAAAGVPPPPPEPSAADLEALEEDDEAAAGEQPPTGGEAFPGQQQQQQQAAAAYAEDDDDAPPPPPPPPPAEPAEQQQQQGPDQVAAALRRIAGHIGRPSKFAKAAALLRELLAQGALRPRHGPLLFSALKAAMAQPAQAADPLLAREFSKLFTAASKVSEVFTTREKAQLDVYGTWAVLRNQLAATDDSFAFNKVVAQVKGMVGELPPAADEDEALLEGLVAAAGAADPVLAAYDQQGQQQQAAGQAQAAPPQQQQAAPQQQQQQPAPAAAAAAAEEDPEADPFGLDALLEQQAAAEAAAAAEARRRREREAAERAARERAAAKSVTWTADEVVVQRRAALLDCLHAAKACYKNAWARTSVDLLVEHFDAHRDRFTPSQRAAIAELMNFVRDQRRLRKLGPSAREVNRDTTAFERARAEWSQATVSHRGKVGAGGDRGAEQWLG